MKSISNDKKRGAQEPAIKGQVSSPVEGQAEAGFSRKVYVLLIVALIIPYLVGTGYFITRMRSGHSLLAKAEDSKPASAPMVSDSSVPCNPGPWGNLEYVRIYIESPDEFLSVKAFEATDERWFFGGRTREESLAYLGQAGLTPEQVKEAGDEKWEQGTNGVYLNPTDKFVISIDPISRQKIYTMLTTFPENEPIQDAFFFPADHFDDFFANSGVDPQTIALIKKLSYPHGRLLFLSDLPRVLKTLDNYRDKQRLAKTVSRRSTLLMKMFVPPNADVDSLLNYWSKAGMERNLRPLLESVARLPNGEHLSLINLLPPLPSARLYTFAFPSLEPVEHDNCHWTSFNFFKDPPDDRYTDITYIRKRIDSDYYPVFSDPRYGDIVFLAKASGDIIHSSVYLADNIVFTKNGGHFLSPWMLMTIPDMVDAFSALTPADEQLKVLYYRNKYY